MGPRAGLDVAEKIKIPTPTDNRTPVFQAVKLLNYVLALYRLQRLLSVKSDVRIITVDELENTVEEPLVVYLRPLIQFLHGENEKNHENFRIADTPPVLIP
jgi:hypothetical protein